MFEMSKSKRLFLFLVIMAASATHAAGRGLGRPATAAEIAGWDIDVRPDGQGLPVGSGSAAQGESLYEAQCASCHGSFGEKTDYIAIAGGVGSLASDSPMRTVGSKLNYATTLWDYINRSMPFTHPKSLKVDEVYAVTAYVLNLNDIIPVDMKLDQRSLPLVKMPNRDGFTTAHGMGTVNGKPDMKEIACMTNCGGPVKITRELPSDFVRDVYGDLRDNFRDFSTSRASKGADVASQPAGGLELVQKYACTACHMVDKALVGPAFRQVAQKYNSAAADMLAAKIKAGGVGVWGAIPMPPQTRVSDADLKSVVTWILAGAKDN